MGSLPKGTLASSHPRSILGQFRWLRPARKASKKAFQGPCILIAHPCYTGSLYFPENGNRHGAIYARRQTGPHDGRRRGGQPNREMHLGNSTAVSSLSQEEKVCGGRSMERKHVAKSFPDV
eukprot:173234-Pyramimonas_sp.AAC.1